MLSKLVIFFTIALAAASPAPRSSRVFTIPIQKRIASGATPKDIIKSDLVRYDGFDHLFPEGKRQSSGPATNVVVSYTASIGIGVPATYYDLIVDTGSSNTWIGAGKAYVHTSSSVSTGDHVSVEYGSGEFTGTEYKETVTLTPTLVITNQYIGVASSSGGFSGVDGILGLGPEDLTTGTVTGISEEPTVVQTAYSEHLIPAQVVGIYFAPSSTDSSTNGEITYGGTDSSKYTGSISYNPVSGAGAAYWGIQPTITIGSKSAGTISCIVDTGTTLVYLPSNVYSQYVSAIPSAVLDSTSGLVRFPKSSLSSVPTLSFTVGGTAFSLNNYAQLVEQAFYADFGLSSSYYYSWINNGGSGSLTCIIGQKFLERFYSVYDTDNNRVGFAHTANSSPTSVP